jgi:hypothetical protein
MKSLRNESFHLAATAAVTLFLALSLSYHSAIALAEEREEPTSAGSRYATEITKVLRPLIEEYGPDAVNLQGNLMRYAIDNGALLQTTVGISGRVQRQETIYLAFVTDTGMVYRASLVDAATGPARIWNDVILPAVRQCKRLNIEADGLEIQSTYRRMEFEDRADLARKLQEGQAFTEAATFRMLSADAIDLAHDRITARELLNRAQVELNGSRIQLQIPTPSEPQT